MRRVFVRLAIGNVQKTRPGIRGGSEIGVAVGTCQEKRGTGGSRVINTLVDDGQALPGICDLGEVRSAGFAFEKGVGNGGGFVLVAVGNDGQAFSGIVGGVEARLARGAFKDSVHDGVGGTVRDFREALSIVRSRVMVGVTLRAFEICVGFSAGRVIGAIFDDRETLQVIPGFPIFTIAGGTRGMFTGSAYKSV